jgi:hypothetical protein
VLQRRLDRQSRGDEGVGDSGGVLGDSDMVDMAKKHPQIQNTPIFCPQAMETNLSKAVVPVEQ